MSLCSLKALYKHFIINLDSHHVSHIFRKIAVNQMADWEVNSLAKKEKNSELWFRKTAGANWKVKLKLVLIGFLSTKPLSFSNSNGHNNKQTETKHLHFVLFNDWTHLIFNTVFWESFVTCWIFLSGALLWLKIWCLPIRAWPIFYN